LIEECSRARPVRARHPVGGAVAGSPASRGSPL
jgi:hypothetical protein